MKRAIRIKRALRIIGKSTPKEKLPLDFLPKEIRSMFKSANDAIKTPIISLSVLSLYFIFLAFYAGTKKINYFDFVGGMGSVPWIIGILFFFLVMYSGMFFIFPSENSFLISQKHEMSRHESIMIHTFPGFSLVSSLMLAYILNKNEFNEMYNVLYTLTSLITSLLISVIIIKNNFSVITKSEELMMLVVSNFMCFFATIPLAYMIFEAIYHYTGNDIIEKIGFLYIIIIEIIYTLIIELLFQARKINGLKSYFVMSVLVVFFIFSVAPGGIPVTDYLLRLMHVGGSIPVRLIVDAKAICNEKLQKLAPSQSLCTSNADRTIVTIPVSLLLTTHNAVYFSEYPPGKTSEHPIVLKQNVVTGYFANGESHSSGNVTTNTQSNGPQ